MAEEVDRRARPRKRVERIARAQQVLVFVAQAAVRATHRIGLLRWRHRPLRQMPQPGDMLGGKHTLRPARGAGGDRVEVFHGGKPAAGAVMVAAHENSTQRAHPLNHFVGVCAISDHIAEVPHRVVRGCQRQHCLQRL